jgi:hypothetical protein
VRHPDPAAQYGAILTSPGVFASALDALARAACKYPDAMVAAVVHVVLLHPVAGGVLSGCR